MATDYSIKLTMSAPDVALFQGRSAFRLVVTASEAVGLPNEIFLHQRTLVNVDTGQQQDEFVAIASAFDLSSYPANEPSVSQSPAYFRKAQLDILLPSVTVFEAVRDEISQQVQVLLNVLGKLDGLQEQSFVLTGASRAPESSSSSSV